jgi:hypothetical protein
LAQQNTSEYTSGVGEVATQVVLDRQRCLALAGDRRRALHQVAPAHPPDGFTERELAVPANLPFEILILAGRAPMFTHDHSPRSRLLPA